MTDLRVVKTKQAIESAFVSLVLEEGFDRITVSELAAKAMINRQTFYQHYLDKFDLAEQMGQEVLKMYDKLGEQRISLSRQNKNVIQIVDEVRPTLREVFHNHRQEITALFKIHMNNFDLRIELTKRVQGVISQLLSGQASEFELAILTGIISSMITYLLTHDDLPSDEEIAEDLVRIKRLFS
ncbi:TetR/AcrR family transcriptional regulator [Secundilactobacillus folii]|uniref:TetR family transcriptional regulator n=1 Tax=Secundilactobacillus folii TaxID=2678357 RepID=A0A7X2XVT8_9LACO|nr:TetR/AcrR family transcriptional regulator [Secundilactobacillus folii]MTV82594.1 TetR family transcriptional regulator [Secundilactobacillus folii]